MTWHSQFQMGTNTLEKRCPQWEFLCARHRCHHHILAECVRRECLHRPPFFALPFALVPPCLLSLCKCLVVFCAWSKRCPKLLLTPESSNRSVLKLVLLANYCNNNRSVRPRGRWVTSAYATWPRLESTPGVQATLLYAGLTLLGATQLRDFCNYVVLQEGSFSETMASWRVIVAQYASAIQLWNCAGKLCGMDPKPPSRGVLHAYVFFFTLPEPHLFCLALAGSTSGRSCGNNEIIRGAMKLSAGGVRFMPRAKAEHTRALTIGLLHATSVSNMYRKVPMQTTRNHTAVHVADEKGALPVVTLILFWRKMHISPLTMGRRCICSLQDEHCAAPALSGLEWKTFACFPHVLCTEGLAYLKTAAINCDLKEPANKNACVFSA